MNLPCTAQRLLHQIDMLDHPGIHRSHFARVMTTEDMIEIVQCGEIVPPALVPITNPQPLISMHVIKRQLAFRQAFPLRTRRRNVQKPAAQEKHPSHRGFQQRSSGPGPIGRLHKIAPEKSRPWSLHT